MSSKRDLSVVIVAGLRLDALKLCLETLRNTTDTPAEFVVVLCNPTADLKEWVYREKSEWTHYDCPHSLVVFKPRKQEVYACYNYGVDKAAGSVVCLINDDMVMAPHWDALAYQHCGPDIEPPALITGELIEPGVVKVASTNHAYNCGTTPAEFNAAKFHEIAENLRESVCGPGRGWFMPVMFRRDAFLSSGGYPTEPPFPAPNDVSFFNEVWPASGGVDLRCGDMVAYHFQRLSQREQKRLHWGTDYLEGYDNILEGDSEGLSDIDVAKDKLAKNRYDYVLVDNMLSEVEDADERQEYIKALFDALASGGAVNIEVDATAEAARGLIEPCEYVGFVRAKVVKGKIRRFKVVAFKPEGG